MLIFLLILWIVCGFVWAIFNFDGMTEFEFQIRSTKKKILFFSLFFLVGGPLTMLIGLAALLVIGIIHYIIVPFIDRILSPAFVKLTDFLGSEGTPIQRIKNLVQIMKIIKEGRDLTQDVYEGKCRICDCKFECGHSDVVHLIFSSQSKCPNCKEQVKVVLQSRKYAPKAYK